MRYLIQQKINPDFDEKIQLVEETPNCLIQYACVAKIDLTPEEFQITNSRIGTMLLTHIFFWRWRKSADKNYEIQEQADDQLMSTYFSPSPIMLSLVKKFREAADKRESQKEQWTDLK